MPVDVDTVEEEIRARRKLRKSGNSVVVSIPSEALQAAGLTVGDGVEVVGKFSSGVIELRKVNGDDA